MSIIINTLLCLLSEHIFSYDRSFDLVEYNNILDHAVVFLVMWLAWMVFFSGLCMVSEGSGNLGFRKTCL